MRRCEIWWAQLPKPTGKRPVILLSRNEAYAVRELVTVAPITTRVRGLPVEVALDKKDGLSKKCVANLDTITTIPKRCLVERISFLSQSKQDDINTAVMFALGLD